jgi:hypothetical protein
VKRVFLTGKIPFLRLVTYAIIDYHIPSGEHMNGYRVLLPASMQVGFAILSNGYAGRTETAPDPGVIVATQGPVNKADFASQQHLSTDDCGAGSDGEGADSGHPVTVGEESSAAYPDHPTAPISCSTLLVWSVPPAA